jgi:hypothetical protein
MEISGDFWGFGMINGDVWGFQQEIEGLCKNHNDNDGFTCTKW